MRYVLVLISLLTLLANDALVAGNWPHWRGPSRNGVSTERVFRSPGARRACRRRPHHRRRRRPRRPVLAASGAGDVVAGVSVKVVL